MSSTASAAGNVNLCQFTRTTDGARCPRKSTRMGPFCKAHAYYIKRKAERATTGPSLYTSEISSPDDTLYSPHSPPQEFFSPSSTSSNGSYFNFSQQSVSSFKSPFNTSNSNLAHLESSAMATLIHFSNNLNSPKFGSLESPNVFSSNNSLAGQSTHSSPMFGASASSGFNLAGDNKASGLSSSSLTSSSSSSDAMMVDSAPTYHVCEWMQDMAGGSMQCGLPVWNGSPYCHDHLMYQNQETLQAAEFLASLRYQTN
jgi:hypothetical protein